jgi:hypothetical protein
MRPVSMKKIKQQLYESGWEVLEVRDLSETFVVWYEQLLQKLEDKKKNDLCIMGNNKIYNANDK